jgi:hypothetical protein
MTYTTAGEWESRGRPAFRLPAEGILTSPWDRLPALLTPHEGQRSSSGCSRASD